MSIRASKENGEIFAAAFLELVGVAPGDDKAVAKVNVKGGLPGDPVAGPENG
jgi:hypothetical protein